MRTEIDMTGKKFGKLTVVGKRNFPKGKEPIHSKWYCECECGGFTNYYGHNLRAGKHTHCGCETGKRLRSNAIDITGKTFGSLTVIEWIPVAEWDRNSRWLCKCECGATVRVLGNNLRSGSVTHCGCQKGKHLRSNAIDITGKKFGLLAVIGRLPVADGERSARWLCNCDCGGKARVYSVALRTGKVTHCGCQKGKRSRKDKDKQRNYRRATVPAGQKFGLLTVVGRVLDNSEGVVLECVCDCGNVTTVDSRYIKSGRTKSCGCLKTRLRTVEPLVQDVKDANNKKKGPLTHIPMGEKFNMLTVVNRAPNVNGKARWKCVCDCGNEVIAYAHHIRAGMTKSCGCLKKNPKT